MKGGLLAPGRSASEAIKARDVWCHGVMFPFHGQSGPIQGLVKKFCPLVPDCKITTKVSRPSLFCFVFPLSIHLPVFTTGTDFVLQFVRVCLCVFQMCSDYEKSLVQPAYENDGLGPRALPETHPLLQDWQVRG